MLLMHEGSCLFIPRKGGGRLDYANDVDLTEACEIVYRIAITEAQWRGKSKPIVSPVVRKVCYPRIAGRRQSQTGWPTA